MRKLLPLLPLSFMALLAASSTVSAQVSVGIQIGEPPAPRAYKVPPQKSPKQEWVEGYWQPKGSKYQWRNGHWAQPPRTGAYWQQPYYSNGRYYSGSWQGGETTKGSGERGRQEPPRTGSSGREGR